MISYIIIFLLIVLNVVGVFLLMKQHDRHISEAYSNGFRDGAERIIRGDYRALEALDRHKKMD